MSMALKASKARAAGSVVPFGGVQQANFRGDPGLFGDIFGGITKVASFIPGPIGGLAGAANRIISGGSGQTVTSTVASRTGGMFAPQAGGPGGPMFPTQQVPVPGITGAVQRFLPGGATGFVSASQPAPGPGYHLNKSDYFLKDGTFVPKGSKWVKNRRRNPLNAKAASSAIRRLESAKKATKRINRVTIRKPAGCK